MTAVGLFKRRFGVGKLDNVRIGWREIDEFGHVGGVLVAEVAVNFHRQCAAVFVAEPSGDGRNVNAALNAAGGE
jgi:hypothetical protein